jgi:xanthine dehydrogenase accessory factor
VYEGRTIVEGIAAVRVSGLSEILALQADATSRPAIAVLVDPDARCLGTFRPAALVDAILAKRNLGTKRGMASLVVGLGPGFTAGTDVDVVIETNRGHDLGRVILEGSAEPDTGRPGEVGGSTSERVLRSPVAGVLAAAREIGEPVAEGDLIAIIETGSEAVPVRTTIGGVLRGLIRPGFEVTAGMKIADVDPRLRRENCYSISDKSRAIAGGLLEALLAAGILPTNDPA